MNALLSVAFLPELVRSLVVMDPKSKARKFSLNTCIFLLGQTFKLLADSSQIEPASLYFLKTLALSLFAKDSLAEDVHSTITSGSLTAKQETKFRCWLNFDNDSLYKLAKHNFSESNNFYTFVERYVYFHEPTDHLEFLNTLHKEV